MGSVNKMIMTTWQWQCDYLRSYLMFSLNRKAYDSVKNIIHLGWRAPSFPSFPSFWSPRLQPAKPIVKSGYIYIYIYIYIYKEGKIKMLQLWYVVIIPQIWWLSGKHRTVDKFVEYYFFKHKYYRIVQLVGQWTFTQEVLVSIPTPDSTWLGVDSIVHPSVGR